MQTVVIAGVGLIGGSFALALRQAGFAGRILGVSSERTIRQALELNVIDAGATLEEACAQADLVYLAGPIRSILDLIPRLDGIVKPGALVTDAGSTKSMICEAGAALRRVQFLGGHPMAGKESRGVGAAEAGLFKGRPYLLTPLEPAALQTPAANEFCGWLQAIGAQQRVASPQEHDAIVACSSHLPQLLSTALASTLASHPDASSIAAAAGPGLVDSTRLALSAWEIWRDILDTNRDAILDALDLFAAEWAQLRERLNSGSLESDFEQASRFAAGLRRGAQASQNGETSS
ncbi:MAG: prephenate dehydrogenase/arogenate dehydrogenase family protein [Candidatus Solibacter usitatus]|nr:prephenate dehydrogenase/arogenate dehydrogenase family protein [Candidatus Solibacter usitatus]